MVTNFSYKGVKDDVRSRRCFLSLRFIWVFLSVFTSFVLACQGVVYPVKPEGVLRKYCEAMSRRDVYKALNYISAQEKKELRESFENAFQLEYEVLLCGLDQWEIFKSDMNDNAASVDIHVSEPNIGALYGEAIATLMKSGTEVQDDEEVRRIVNEEVKKKIKKGEIEFIRSDVRIRFSRENGQWKLLRLKTEALGVWMYINKGFSLFQEGEYQEAKSLFENALSIELENEVAKFYLMMAKQRLAYMKVGDEIR